VQGKSTAMNKRYLQVCLFSVFLISVALSGEIEGIWQTETESEFDIRLYIDGQDKGIIEWRAKDMQNQTAVCSTWTFKWKRNKDSIKISTQNEKCSYTLESGKDYQGYTLFILKPYKIDDKASFLKYQFYKFGKIPRFEEKWQKYNCRNENSGTQKHSKTRTCVLFVISVSTILIALLGSIMVTMYADPFSPE
jgi:hypothetical protein